MIQFLPGVRPLPQSLAAHLYTRILMLFPAKETPASAQSAALAEHALCSYGQSILRLAYSYLRNQSDAEDILQETLVRLLRSAPEFETQEHEKAWLLHVAANLAGPGLRLGGGIGSAGALAGSPAPILSGRVLHGGDCPDPLPEGIPRPFGSPAGTHSAQGGASRRL